MNTINIFPDHSKLIDIENTNKIILCIFLKITDSAIKENINAYVHGPLAFDNAVSPDAAAIKNISNEVAGKADILLVPNLETGNSLS